MRKIATSNWIKSVMEHRELHRVQGRKKSECDSIVGVRGMSI